MEGGGLRTSCMKLIGVVLVGMCNNYFCLHILKGMYESAKQIDSRTLKPI